MTDLVQTSITAIAAIGAIVGGFAAIFMYGESKRNADAAEKSAEEAQDANKIAKHSAKAASVSAAASIKANKHAKNSFKLHSDEIARQRRIDLLTFLHANIVYLRSEREGNTQPTKPHIGFAILIGIRNRGPAVSILRGDLTITKHDNTNLPSNKNLAIHPIYIKQHDVEFLHFFLEQDEIDTLTHDLHCSIHLQLTLADEDYPLIDLPDRDREIAFCFATHWKKLAKGKIPMFKGNIPSAIVYEEFPKT